MEAFKNAVDHLSRLPGIGKKSARRLVFHLLSIADSEVDKLTESLQIAKSQLDYCSRCFGLAEGELCKICQDPERTSGRICVVGQPQAIFTLENTGDFSGRYHVLRGLISPLEGIGPEQLTIKNLLQRVKGEKENIEEIIFAFNPTNEGEVTMNYLQDKLAPYEVKLTHLGYGLPVGSDLEYADRMTLSKAFENRIDLDREEE